MRIGIKSEIHSCTIEFAKVFLNNYFSDEDFKLIEKALKMRINSQYYVNTSIPDKDFKEVFHSIPSFFIKCKQINLKLTEKEINLIKEEFLN